MLGWWSVRVQVFRRFAVRRNASNMWFQTKRRQLWYYSRFAPSLFLATSFIAKDSRWSMQYMLQAHSHSYTRTVAANAKSVWARTCVRVCLRLNWSPAKSINKFFIFICVYFSVGFHLPIYLEAKIPKPLLEEGNCESNQLACADATCLPNEYFCDGSVSFFSSLHHLSNNNPVVFKLLRFCTRSYNDRWWLVPRRIIGNFVVRCYRFRWLSGWIRRGLVRCW